MPKQGRSLTELAQEIERQAQSKRDFVADSSLMLYEPEGNRLCLKSHNGGLDFRVGDICHEQIASRLEIPRAYYERMRAKQPTLLAQNINTWLHSEPSRYMVRTLDQTARALLSDRYRPLDNWDLAQATLPALSRIGAEVVSCEITERRMYLKAIVHSVRATVVGDVVEAGVAISNSEVGAGRVYVDPYVNKLSCLNGAVIRAAGLKQTHVGRRLGRDEMFSDIAEDFFRADTRSADDRAFWMKVRDVVGACCEEVQFAALVKRIEAAAGREIEKDPAAVIEEVSRRFGFGEDEQGGLLKYLVKGGDLSQWGLANAVTRLSQDVESYDRATDLERFGGQIIELPATEWKVLAGKN